MSNNIEYKVHKKEVGERWTEINRAQKTIESWIDNQLVNIRRFQSLAECEKEWAKWKKENP